MHRHEQPEEGVEQEEDRANGECLRLGDDALQACADVRLEVMDHGLGTDVPLEPLDGVVRLVLEGLRHYLRQAVEVVADVGEHRQELLLVPAQPGQHGRDVGHDERVHADQRGNHQSQGRAHGDEPQHRVLPSIAAMPSALQERPVAELGHVRPRSLPDPGALSAALLHATEGVEAVAAAVQQEERQAADGPELVGHGGDKVTDLPEEELPELDEPLQDGGHQCGHYQRLQGRGKVRQQLDHGTYSNDPDEEVRTVPDKLRDL
mmetsp:Transcript_47420/g.149014  ORF Transcript_47420/g.149014 Transcript_47420/m.149014 type:complete len:263 (-) Transcript_47420:131-919(-)